MLNIERLTVYSIPVKIIVVNNAIAITNHYTYAEKDLSVNTIVIKLVTELI